MNCKKECAGCAFRENSPANQEVISKLTGIITVLSPTPFYCHESFDWKNPDLQNKSILEIRKTGGSICQGWRREVGLLAETGYYDQKINVKVAKVFGRIALNALEQIKNSTAEDKKDLHKAFRAFQKIPRYARISRLIQRKVFMKRVCNCQPDDTMRGKCGHHSTCPLCECSHPKFLPEKKRRRRFWRR